MPLSRFFAAHKRLFIALAILFVYSTAISFATPPGSPYNPGETLDPTCAPGATNCSVTFPSLPDQTGHNTHLLTTDGSSASWTDTIESLTLNTPTIGGAASDPSGVDGMLYYSTASDTLRLFDETVGWTDLISSHYLTDNYYSQDNLGNAGDSEVSWYNITNAPIIGASSDTRLIDGGEVVHTTGYSFTVSAANYEILGDYYSSPQTPITLSPSDPTNDRIDVVVVNTSGAVQVIEGTPADPAVAPYVDPSTQLTIATIRVTANSTEPDIDVTDIYHENLGTGGGEWGAVSTNTGKINPNSTNNPRNGSKDIEGTTVTSGTSVTFTPASPLNLDSATQVILHIRSKGTWGKGRRVVFLFQSSTGQAGNAVSVATSGTYGFNSANTSSYQQVAIPMVNFGIPGGTNVTSLTMSASGGSAFLGFYIDDITIESGGTTVIGSTKSYIENQNTGAQGANSWISGVMRANTGAILGSSNQALSQQAILDIRGVNNDNYIRLGTQPGSETNGLEMQFADVNESNLYGSTVFTLNTSSLTYQRSDPDGSLIQFSPTQMLFDSTVSGNNLAMGISKNAEYFYFDGGDLYFDSNASTVRYIGFDDANRGSDTYGFRDNNGTIEFKNSGGSWTAFGTGGGGGSVCNNCTFSGDGAISYVGTSYIGVTAGRGSLGTTEGTSSNLSNILIGNNTGDALTSGTNNVFIGQEAGEFNTSGTTNTFVGYHSGFSNSTGADNTFLGESAGSDNSTGSRNLFAGVEAGTRNQSGDYNTILGPFAGSQLTSGSYNILIGKEAGVDILNGPTNLTSGSNNIVIGTRANIADGTASNQLSIGNLIYGNGLDGEGPTVSSGNIGIGITNPQARLNVASSILVQNSDANDDGVYISDSVNGSTGLRGLFDGGIDEIAAWDIGNLRYSYGGGEIRINTGGIGVISAVTFGSYGQGNYTGTPAYSLAVDASGNVIETPFSGGISLTDANTSLYSDGLPNNSYTSTYASYDQGNNIVLGGGNAYNFNSVLSSNTAYSVILGTNAARDTVGSISLSNVIGAGYGDEGILGAAYGVTGNIQYSNIFGMAAGSYANSVTNSNFIGTYAGANALSAIDGSNFIGPSAGRDVTDADDANFIGQDAGRSVVNGDNSNFIGYEAGKNASNGFFSNFIGSDAGLNATNADNSNFLGASAGWNATNANNSNFIGANAGIGAASASNSVFIGTGVGRAFTSNDVGTNNIIIGTNISLSNATANSINIGGVLFGTGNYGTTTGNPSIIAQTAGKIGIARIPTTYTLEVGNSSVSGIVARFQNSSGTCDINPTSSSLSCSSDETLKKNITDLETADLSMNDEISEESTVSETILSKVLSLRPVTYNWNTEDDSAPVHTGFIAQEVEQIFPGLVTTDEATNLKSLNYIGFIPYTIQALKEMNITMQSLPIFSDQTFATNVANFLRAVGEGAQVVIDTVTTKKLCVEDVCVTRDQFLKMVNKAEEGPQVIVVPQQPTDTTGTTETETEDTSTQTDSTRADTAGEATTNEPDTGTTPDVPDTTTKDTTETSPVVEEPSTPDTPPVTTPETSNQ